MFKPLSFGLFVAVAVAAVCAVARGAEYNGTCGEVMWFLDTIQWIFTVRGKGYMSPCEVNATLAHQVKSVVVEDGVRSICAKAFPQFGSFYSLTIGETVESIGEDLLANNPVITSLTIPKSVTSIGDRAFFGLNRLRSIDVMEGNEFYESVDGILFNKGRTTLIVFPPGKPKDSYEIPDTVKTIAYGAFAKCSQLTSITIPKSVTSIESVAFQFCDGLKTITIPDSITSISSGFCDSCGGLTTVNIPNSVISIGNEAFAFCPSLESIVIPDSVTYIGKEAFGTSALSSVVIGNSTQTIDDNAFVFNLNLESIVIPASVQMIGGFAFGATGLKQVAYLGASAPDYGSNVFSDIYPPSVCVPSNYNSKDFCGDENLQPLSACGLQKKH